MKKLNLLCVHNYLFHRIIGITHELTAPELQFKDPGLDDIGRHVSAKPVHAVAGC